MAIVVFEMIALGFEDVSVLVFHLPPCSSCLNQLGDIAPSEGEVGNKGILRACSRSFPYLHKHQIIQRYSAIMIPFVR